MNKQRAILMSLALVLIGGTSLGLHWLKSHQRLGRPGIKTSEIPGSPRLNVYLPEQVLDYDSVMIPTDTNVFNGLPHDTSFAERRYMRPNEHPLLMNIVLMGSDRTSIHKPQFCLAGSGWNIDDSNSALDTVRVESPYPYDLPVMKIASSREVTDNQGRPVTVRGIYVYWFVADHDLTAEHWVRMRRMATHLLQTGELERWAYVSCLGYCLPGEDENAAYQRIKKFIAAAVPKFQLAANPPVAEQDSSRMASR